MRTLRETPGGLVLEVGAEVGWHVRGIGYEGKRGGEVQAVSEDNTKEVYEEGTCGHPSCISLDPSERGAGNGRGAYRCGNRGRRGGLLGGSLDASLARLGGGPGAGWIPS